MLDILNVFGTSTAATAVATDLAGNVIWYYEPGPSLQTLRPNPIKLLPNGHMLINYTNTASSIDGTSSVLQEVDLAGNLVWQMKASDLNTALANAGFNLTVVGTHHDVAILPNGHLIVIATQQVSYSNLTGIPGTTLVTGERADRPRCKPHAGMGLVGIRSS